MSPALLKIQRLIALAANRGAEDAEARTAAHIAAKLIHEHGIELHDPHEHPTNSPETRLIRSRYAGRCNRCGGPYIEGDVVAWTKGRGAAHASCRR